MASVIWLTIRKQRALKIYIRDNPNTWMKSPIIDYIRPIISKGNIIEGIEAKA